MSAHPARTWLIVTGVVLLVVQAALVVCWWKLPMWAPDWVIAHSPWPEPVLRAFRQSRGSHSHFRFQLSEFGPAIGPALLRQYGNGDTTDRLLMLVLATDLAVVDGVRPNSGPPPRRFTSDEVVVLREELVEMARLAFTEGSLVLGESASFLAARLRDRRLTPLMCGILHGQSTPIGPEVSNVVTALGELGDPRAVPTLIPLLPIRHKPHPMVEEALDKCLPSIDKGASSEVEQAALKHVIAATRHPHEVVRTWAAKQFPRLPLSEEFVQCLITLLDDPERQVRLAAIEALRSLPEERIGVRFLAFAQHDSDPLIRQAAILGLGHVEHHAAIPYLRTLLGDQEFHAEVVISLGHLDDREVIPHLLKLLHHEDKSWGFVAFIILSGMPLTPEQRREYNTSPKLWIPGSQEATSSTP